MIKLTDMFLGSIHNDFISLYVNQKLIINDIFYLEQL